MKISVCLTHYNRPHLLAATLESLARQTRVPDEVLLWDDCSPNDPTEVARAYKARFPRFVYQRNSRNLGMPGNLNAVLAAASGDLIANLHDADVFHPELLQKWEHALLAHPQAGLVFCGLDASTGTTQGERIWIHPCAKYAGGHDFFRDHYVGTTSSMIWGTVMVRRDVYEKHLPFDPQFRNWADVDMWMRICRTDGIAYVPEALIKLDHTPTPVRGFSWDKFLITHRMHAVNIHRIAANRVEQAEWMARQKKVSRSYYFRHLASRLGRFQWRLFAEGVALWPHLFSKIFDRDWKFPEPTRAQSRARKQPPAPVGPQLKALSAGWTKTDPDKGKDSVH